MAATDGGLDYGDDDGSGMDLTTHVTAWVGLAPAPGNDWGAGGPIGGGRTLSQQGRRRQARKRRIANRQVPPSLPRSTALSPPVIQQPPLYPLTIHTTKW